MRVTEDRTKHFSSYFRRWESKLLGGDDSIYIDEYMIEKERKMVDREIDEKRRICMNLI